MSRNGRPAPPAHADRRPGAAWAVGQRDADPPPAPRDHSCGTGAGQTQPHPGGDWLSVVLLRRSSTAPGVAVVGTGIRWSAGVRQECEPFESCCDVAGPGPVPGQAEDPRTASGHELPGRGEKAEPRSAAFPAPGPARQCEHRHPGQQVRCDLHDLQRTRFWAVRCRGRFRMLVARAVRLRSSARARSRGWSSSSAIGRPDSGTFSTCW